MTTDAKSPSAYIGSRMRALREEHDKRQDEVASAARRWGLRWTQATVAAVETGRRDLSLGELLLLPLVLSFGLPTSVELPDLFSGRERLELAPGCFINAENVRAVLAGDALKLPPKAIDVEWVKQAAASLRRALEGVTDEVDDRVRQVQQFWPEVKFSELEAAERDAGQLAERRAAQRLGVEPLVLAAAARHQWGRGFTAERDDRLASEGGSSSLTARRGHITRAMTDELRSILRLGED